MRRRPLVIGLAIGCSLLIAAAVGVWLWLGAGDAEPEFEASTDLTSDSADGDAPADDRGDDSGLVATKWEVSFGDSTDLGVGYRILEDLPVGGPETITARTTEVSGSMTIDDAVLSDVNIEVDLDSLSSGNDLRDSIVASNHLEVEAFPVATLVVDEDTLIEIPDVAGELADFVAEADLTIHGKTSTVDVVGQGQWGDGVVEIVGTIDTALSDFGISRPDLAGRTARDEVIVEFKLRFVPG